MTPRRPTPPRSSRGTSRPSEGKAHLNERKARSRGEKERSRAEGVTGREEKSSREENTHNAEPEARDRHHAREQRARKQHSANSRPSNAANTMRAKQSRPPSATKGVGEALGQNYAIRIRGRRGVRQYSAKFLIFTTFLLASLLILASPLTRSIEQSHEVASAKAQLEEVQAHREELQQQLNLWQDENYIRSQARERLGYVMPGETLYSVKLPGQSEDRQQHVQEVNRTRLKATPWFVTLWESMRLADGASGGSGVDNPQQVPVIEQPANEQPASEQPTTQENEGQ